MKRQFTLYVFIFVSAIAILAQKPVVNVQRAKVNPVIDGLVDEVWADAGDPVSIVRYNPEDGAPTLGDSGQTTWRALWTFEGIYVLIQVADDEFLPHYLFEGAFSWEYDKPEFYFDVNWVLEDGLGPMGGQGHYQVAPEFTEGSIDGTSLTCGFNGNSGNIVDYAHMVEDPVYTSEYFVPFSSMQDKDGLEVDLTAEIGFDVTILDRDDGDVENKAAVWNNDGVTANSWENMDDCGIILLEGADEGILVDEITLTGGTIDENNGTLQIQASFLPENASNKFLTWSVQNTSGKATVDKDGVVRGIIDGEVTVKAMASDGSFTEGETTVLISNQIVTMNEINEINNAYFDDEDGSSAAGWGGWGGDANSPMPTVRSGIAVCTPTVDGEAVWQYSFSQSGLNAAPEEDYYFSFLAWADESRPFQASFEDTEANNWNRYGKSDHPDSQGGRSQWNFDIDELPTWYTFDVNFDQMVESTVQIVSFHIGTS
jgi:hypothetical protein